MSDNNNQKSQNRPYNNRYRGQNRRHHQQAQNNQRPSSARSTKSSISETDYDGSSTCICCLHKLTTFVTYSCMHFVCLQCALKMRILLEKFDCPVCRQLSDEVICDKDNLIYEKSDEDKIKMCDIFMHDAKKLPGGINYKNDTIKNEYDSLLEHKCDSCMHKFGSFDDLSKHIQTTHKRYFCDLCVKHVKLFSHERKHYNREELALHRRKGDTHDKSLKGHPNCDYCNERFFDRDELYRHFRRDHYYCHFCDADGFEEYYSNYQELRTHFLKCHFLCEQDECAPRNVHETREYVVFRNNLDLQAHCKTKHARSRNEVKSLSKVQLDFNYRTARDNRVRGTERVENTERVSNYHENQRNTNPRGVSGSNQRSSNNYENNRNSNTLGASLRDLYQNYETAVPSQSQIVSVETQPAQVQPPVVEPSPPPALTTIVEAPQQAATQVPQQEQSTWRDLIGQGRAPKINKETEFPSLSEVSSLATIGQNIEKSNAWASKFLKPKIEVMKFDKPKNETKNSNKSGSDSVSSMVNLKSYLNETHVQPKQETFEQVKGKNSDMNELEQGQSKTKTKKIKNKKKTEDVDLNEKTNDSSSTHSAPPGFPPLNGYEGPKIEVRPLPAPPPGFSAVAKSNLIADAYKKSTEYEELNKKLNDKLTDLFDKTQFEKFRMVSIEFRNSQIDAETYLAKCNELVSGKIYKKFLLLNQEMIVLLPNISKQNELYEAYLKQVRKVNNDSSLPFNIPEDSIRLAKCSECNQILIDNFELRLHIADNHKSEINNNSSPQSTTSKKPNIPQQQIQAEDFPALASNASIRNTLSDLPSFRPATNSIFNNPNESLSLVNKKKYKPRYLDNA